MVEIINQTNDKIDDEFKEARKDYLQIFGVFASIITLVGFNANSAQKGILEIIVGNFTLGFVLIGFIYLLYVVPKRVSDGKSFINLPEFKNLFKKWYFYVLLSISIIFIILILILIFWAGWDEKTNLGLCSIYPFPKLEINAKIYCLK